MTDSRLETDRTTLQFVLRWPTARAKQWVRSFLMLAKGDQNIISIVAIGSAVRESVQSIDLDLVVISKDDSKLKLRPPLEIDVRVYRESEVAALISQGNDLLSWSLMFGKVLFQRCDYWDKLSASWRDRIPLPSYDVAIDRARKAFEQVKEMIQLGDENAASELTVSCLTHLARAQLLKAGQYPKSRPELPDQLEAIGAVSLAAALNLALARRPMSLAELKDVVDEAQLSGISERTHMP